MKPMGQMYYIYLNYIYTLVITVRFFYLGSCNNEQKDPLVNDKVGTKILNLKLPPFTIW